MSSVPLSSSINFLPPVIQEALRKPSGSRFYFCALQVNPHHYSQTYRGQTGSLSESQYVSEIMRIATELGISVLAITDHNHVGSIELFRKAAAGSDIHIFPGFEVESSEGVHVLCLYPLHVQVSQLERYLGELGIRNTAPSTDLSDKTLSEILKAVLNHGGITIAAHITENKGLLNALHGTARMQAWKDSNLIAVQIPGSVDQLPVDKKPIITNRDPSYQRDHACGENLSIAVINAKDIVAPNDLADPSATMWIKMSDISIEGLRQAFLDPISRIRLNTDPPLENHTEFVAISWEGGFLDGVKIHFNENLNALIGGRGTGKSTVVESIRFVLDLRPVGEESAVQHNGILKNVIRAGTKISLLIRSHKPALREYLIERTVSGTAGPTVKDDKGNLLSVRPSDVIPRVEIFGQHEISEIARSPEKRTVLLTRFIETDHEKETKKSKIKSDLERSRTQLLTTQKEKEDIDNQVASLPSIQEKIKRFEDAGYQSKLELNNLIAEEIRLLAGASESLKPFSQAIENLRELLPVDCSMFDAEAIQTLPNKSCIKESEKILSIFEKVVNEAVASLDKALQEASTSLTGCKGRWEKGTEKVRAECEKALRQMKGPEGAQYIQLKNQQAQIAPLKEKQKVVEKKSKELETTRRKLLVEWEDIKAEEFRRLEVAAKKVTRFLANRVRINVVFAGNRAPLVESIKSLGGRTSDVIEILDADERFSVAEFVKACQSGAQTLIDRYGFSVTQAEKFSKLQIDFILKLEELDLPPTSSIELNVAAEGQPPIWQTLENLSTGQKATAILFLLLLESESPLVVDQPEDDLDNRFISDGIVPTMRVEKRRRQFICATHNANIPVLGDAELILGLEVRNGKADIPERWMASIDSEPVSILVKEVLEGGRDAFELRRLKYGF